MREMTAVASPDSASRRAKVGKAAALVEPTEPSSALLAQVAAIKESAERHRGEDVSESESEEEEDMESSELLKKTLKMYYHDLGSADGEGGESSALLPGLPCLQLVMTACLHICHGQLQAKVLGPLALCQ